MVLGRPLIDYSSADSGGQARSLDTRGMVPELEGRVRLQVPKAVKVSSDS
jgi:hypothetical protein